MSTKTAVTVYQYPLSRFHVQGFETLNVPTKAGAELRVGRPSRSPLDSGTGCYH